jgi:NodT family efflux transporter outer membrane factor (OMF) lipoprotein
MRFPLIIRAWPLVLLLAACAPVGPDYTPPAPDLPAGWSTEHGGRPPAATASGERWWSLFDDPLLDELIDRAITANHDLRIAGSRIKAARARYRIAATSSGPSLAAGASTTHSRRSDTSGSTNNDRDSQNLFQADFDANWEIDLSGGQRRTIEASSAAFEASLENRRDVLITLEAEVAGNYFELRGSQKRLTTARASLAAQDMTLDTVQGRFDLGLASRLEVVQTETQKALLAAQIPELEKNIAESASRLALLLNLPRADLVSRLAEPVITPDLPLTLPAGLPSDLLRRRPDIRLAERRLAAATAGIGVATADLFPRFSLSALVGLQSSSLADLVDSGSRFWSLGPSLSLPLFNRQELHAAVDITKAEHEEMIATYEQTVLAALIEVENTLIQFAREQEVRSSLAEAVTKGRQAVTFNEGLYKAGLADLTDVLAGQRTFYQAEDQLLQAEQQLLLSTIALYKALGGGWEIAERTAAAPTANQPSQNFQK